MQLVIFFCYYASNIKDLFLKKGKNKVILQQILIDFILSFQFLLTTILILNFVSNNLRFSLYRVYL